MSMLTPFKRASGLGTTNDGVHHWWMQRLTAVALTPLTLWMVFAVAAHAGDDYASVAAWFAQPMTTTLLTLFVFTTFLHAAQGLTVIIEDYLHHEGAKFAALIGMKLVLVLLGVSSTLSILRVAFAG
ncbi:MAG: succinate dehydrogenase, hydrophobic membrane anchor protein [Thiothrix sp.]|jgi:succinate dehydrogenase / fumarate reductase membrane anchor subunit|uniref:succinate dehydrogenase, hydrophobic membrane anchor protein n=1 Tax=Thiothrix sp. TaxID=1032 RepID=UPI0026183A10|nr:succinate dehydrogenase, hydrophobic membrane anchor protein [Thiothrix sp.]MDD5394261.1 succinate dehydrogenase, hydrophobic membrane anchor protein [Thiothrix sp.]